MRSEPLPGTPLQIEAAVRKLTLEGVVAKRRDSQYELGKRGRAWVKVKFNRWQEFVMAGLSPTQRILNHCSSDTTRAPSCISPVRFGRV